MFYDTEQLPIKAGVGADGNLPGIPPLNSNFIHRFFGFFFFNFPLMSIDIHFERVELCVCEVWQFV